MGGSFSPGDSRAFLPRKPTNSVTGQVMWALWRFSSPEILRSFSLWQLPILKDSTPPWLVAAHRCTQGCQWKFWGDLPTPSSVSPKSGASPLVRVVDVYRWPNGHHSRKVSMAYSRRCLIELI